MKRVPVALLTALGMALSNSTSAAEPAGRLPIELPQDQSTPIIVLDFDDTPSDRRSRDDLYLAIYANGQVIVSATGDRGRQLRGRIPQREFQLLLQDLLIEKRLLGCRTSQLQQDVRSARRARQRPEPDPDAATTVIRVRGADSSHEIRCHALGLTANQLPELTQVQELFACQRRLENVAAIIRAGGYDNVNAMVSAANLKLRQQAPSTELLTCRELNLVDLRPDGSTYLQFARIPNADGLQPAGGYVMVSVYQTPVTSLRSPSPPTPPDMPAPPADPLPSPTRRNLLWWTLQHFFQILCAVLFRYQSRGLENVPADGAALLLVNHQSYLDPILLGLPLRRPISMVARKNLFQIPVLGRILKGLYGLEIDRDAPGTAVIREIVRRLDHGFLVAIFPEGTRSSGTELGPIKPGFVSILRRANVPVIPVGIAGADRALPRGAWIVRPVTIRVTIGKPIPTSELDPLKSRGHEDELLFLVAGKMQAVVDQSAMWLAE